MAQYSWLVLLSHFSPLWICSGKKLNKAGCLTSTSVFVIWHIFQFKFFLQTDCFYIKCFLVLYIWDTLAELFLYQKYSLVFLSPPWGHLHSKYSKIWRSCLAEFISLLNTLNSNLFEEDRNHWVVMTVSTSCYEDYRCSTSLSSECGAFFWAPKFKIHQAINKKWARLLKRDILHWEQLERVSTALDIPLPCSIALYNLCTTEHISVALLKIPLKILHGWIIQQK